MDLETFIPLVHDLGLDVIDFHLGKGFRSKEPGYIHHIRSLCLRHGLPVGYVGSVGNFVGSDEVVQKRMDQARFDVGVTVALGAPLVRLFSASLPPDVPDRQSIWDQMIRNFQVLADEALEHGIVDCSDCRTTTTATSPPRVRTSWPFSTRSIDLTSPVSSTPANGKVPSALPPSVSPIPTPTFTVS